MEPVQFTVQDSASSKFSRAAAAVTSLNIEIISKDNAAITPEEYLKNFKENMSEGINEKLVTVGEITTQKLFGVDALVFDGCKNLTTVNYNGSEEEWNNMNISIKNDFFINATRNYLN